MGAKRPALPGNVGAPLLPLLPTSTQPPNLAPRPPSSLVSLGLYLLHLKRVTMSIPSLGSLCFDQRETSEAQLESKIP
jgi:hypothetical protein